MARIQVRRGTASAWTTANPVLSAGEFGHETDTGKVKLGNGSTAWTSLGYFSTLALGTTSTTAKAGDYTPTSTEVTTALGFTPVDAASKAQANGVASLDGSALVPANQLPSYVDDVLEYADLAAMPATGVSGKIYVALDSNLVYRWSGSTYIEISPSPGSTDGVTEGSTNLYYTNTRADNRISAAVGVTVQAFDSDLAAFAGKTAPTGDVVGTTDTQTLSAKTLTAPVVTDYTESVVAIGTVTTAHTLALTNGTVQTATLTASTACTFTMPTATAGKSFVLLLKQAAATGGGTATFTGVKWTGDAPTVTAAAGKMDIFSFFADGSSWYGSVAAGYTP